MKKMSRSVLTLYGAAVVIFVGGAVDLYWNRSTEAVPPPVTATTAAPPAQEATGCFGLQRDLVVAYQPFPPFLTAGNPPAGYVADVINAALADAGCRARWEPLAQANGDVIIAPPHALAHIGGGNFAFSAPYASLPTRIARAKSRTLDTLTDSKVVLAEKDLLGVVEGCCGAAKLVAINDVESGRKSFLTESSVMAIILHADRAMEGTDTTKHAVELVELVLRAGFRAQLQPHEAKLNAALQKAASGEKLLADAKRLAIKPGGV